jgi:type II secretory pathway component PulK
MKFNKIIFFVFLLSSCSPYIEKLTLNVKKIDTKDNCYCKYVSSKKNQEMYDDISHLLGLYAYTKDKVHIKPYVVIGKNL